MVVGAMVVPGITVVPGIEPETHVGVVWLKKGGAEVVVGSSVQAVSVRVFSTTVVPLMTVQGTGVPLLTVPGMVEGATVVPGITVVPGM